MLTLISKLILKIAGWKIDYNIPSEMSNKYVLMAAPHTSNWDFLYAMCTFRILKIPIKFTIKKEWMRFPFNLLMTPLGAVGIDRNPVPGKKDKKSMVEAMVDLFKEREELVVVVTAEGTRKKVEKWRTGFYHVATLANVPIALGYLDYKKKIAGVGKIMVPSGDIKKDMKEMMDFYKHYTPKFPEKFSLDLQYI
jgi:1-acyl-sn-glycerol-3-phosphate acyltransferase